jgi:general stress protein YciG
MGIESELEPRTWTIEQAAQRERVDALVSRLRKRDYSDPVAPVAPKPVPLKRGIQGFASMSPERVKAIAGLGGRAAHERGVAHEWSSEEARVNGRKGGHATAAKRNPTARSNRPDARCGLCRREGHYADACPKRKKKIESWTRPSRGVVGPLIFGCIRE